MLKCSPCYDLNQTLLGFAETRNIKCWLKHKKHKVLEYSDQVPSLERRYPTRNMTYPCSPWMLPDPQNKFPFAFLKKNSTILENPSISSTVHSNKYKELLDFLGSIDLDTSNATSYPLAHTLSGQTFQCSNLFQP